MTHHHLLNFSQWLEASATTRQKAGALIAAPIFLKMIAIELTRSGYKTLIAAIHPGTTETELFRNFLGTVRHKVWTPEASANNILNVINILPNEGTGLFKN